MSTSRPPKRAALHRGSYLVRLLTEIRALTVELADLQRQPVGEQQLQRTERTIERQRWQLAAAARRAATDELSNAA
jgi:hypothetical protein